MSREKIIVALDVAGANQAKEIISELRGEVGAFKIGLRLFVAAGSSFVKETVEAGAKIFLDLKFHDIPNTAAAAAVEAARLGVWMFNVHAVGGGEMMRRTIESVGEACAKENTAVPKIIGVTVLTSSNDDTLNEVGVDSNAEKQVLKLAKLTAASGLHGVVASPREIFALRREIGDRNFLIVTPGIRTAAVIASDDQKRTMSAAEAIAAGADYLVIGRPITESGDPRAAARQIIGAVEKRLENAAI